MLISKRALEHRDIYFRKAIKVIVMKVNNKNIGSKALGYLWLYPVKCTFVGQTDFPFTPKSFRVEFNRVELWIKKHVIVKMIWRELIKIC